MKRLWVHEVLRVYGDRLIDDNDANWLAEQIRRTLSNQMSEDMNELFKDLLDDENTLVINHFSYCFINYKLIHYL